MDLIEEILSDWQVQRPDIDCSGKAVICSLLYSYRHIIVALEQSLKPLGIKPNVFSVLVTIRRKGADAEIAVNQIMKEVLVTSGAMSNLLNRLVQLKLIKKRQARKNEDARSVFIKLTPKGMTLVDKAMEVQAACERKLTQALTAKESEQLFQLLKKIQPEVYFYGKLY